MPCINLDDYETLARSQLAPMYFDYFAGGAQNEITLNANREAFNSLKLLPRVLQGTPKSSVLDLSTELLNCQLTMPVLIAPTAFHCLANPQGECATAKAASKAGTVMIISMASTTTIEDIISAAASKENNIATGTFWFQLYIQPDRGFTTELVKRAENAGCKALVVTVDSPTFGLRERDLRHNFCELPQQYHCANLKLTHSDTYRSIKFDTSLNWKDITWLRSITHLPIVIKGLCHPADAQLAVEHGINAIIVSNHGGRQLDTMPASITLLPWVVDAVNGQIPILVDGGFRRGTDIVKALSLGASAVAIGRPIIWGLATCGQEGVTQVLNILQKELRNALMLCGCQSLQALSCDIIFTDKTGIK